MRCGRACSVGDGWPHRGAAHQAQGRVGRVRGSGGLVQQTSRKKIVGPSRKLRSMLDPMSVGGLTALSVVCGLSVVSMCAACRCKVSNTGSDPAGQVRYSSAERGGALSCVVSRRACRAADDGGEHWADGLETNCTTNLNGWLARWSG